MYYTLSYGEVMTGGWIVTVWFAGDEWAGLMAHMTGVHDTLRAAVREADLWMAAH